MVRACPVPPGSGPCPPTFLPTVHVARGRCPAPEARQVSSARARAAQPQQQGWQPARQGRTVRCRPPARPALPAMLRSSMRARPGATFFLLALPGNACLHRRICVSPAVQGKTAVDTERTEAPREMDELPRNPDCQEIASSPWGVAPLPGSTCSVLFRAVPYCSVLFRAVPCCYVSFRVVPRCSVQFCMLFHAVPPQGSP
eukprot:gene15759-biopygen11252